MMTASAVVLEDNPAIVADWEVQSDNAELENEKRQTDSSDYEETYVKKRLLLVIHFHSFILICPT